MIYSLLILILLFSSIFIIDAIPQFYTWQSRIKIGRFINHNLWTDKVASRAFHWLNATPTIKLTDQNRLIILDILKGNYERKAIQSWQEAALVLGLSENLSADDEDKIQKKITKLISKKIDSSGRWKVRPQETDEAILAYAFLNLNFINHLKYKPAYDEMYQMLLSLKGEDETIAYKKHNKEYRFVDTVGFICPFLTLYGLKFNVPEAINLAINQLLSYQKYGMMSSENLPYHTYHTSSKIPVGLAGWGRGLGWFAIGIADTWKNLPNDHQNKAEIEEIIIKILQSIGKYQEKNGGFHWLLFDKNSRLDSSTAATLGYLCSVAQEIPEIADESKIIVENALHYLKSVTRRNGAVDFSQGDTKAVGVYSQNFDILPFTQGYLLRILNLKK